MMQLKPNLFLEISAHANELASKVFKSLVSVLLFCCGSLARLIHVTVSTVKRVASQVQKAN
jgi:hypothetical protein